MLNYSKHLCTKCVSPHSAESVTFDNKGLCSVCHQIKFKDEKIDWKKRSAEFDELLLRFRKKNDYDCIVPFSGGKDSTFTLWYLVKIAQTNKYLYNHLYKLYSNQKNITIIHTIRYKL